MNNEQYNTIVILPTRKHPNEKFPRVGIILLRQSAWWADWKPTASVCSELIYQPVIKAKAFVGDVVFGHSIVHPRYYVCKHAQLVVKYQQWCTVLHWHECQGCFFVYLTFLACIGTFYVRNAVIIFIANLLSKPVKGLHWQAEQPPTYISLHTFFFSDSWLVIHQR